jgi:hypothetical protein
MAGEYVTDAIDAGESSIPKGIEMLLAYPNLDIGARTVLPRLNCIQISSCVVTFVASIFTNTKTLSVVEEGETDTVRPANVVLGGVTLPVNVMYPPAVDPGIWMHENCLILAPFPNSPYPAACTL